MTTRAFDIREDWPKKDVRFYHMGPLIANQLLFKSVIEQISRQYVHQGITHVVSLGSRGFLPGTLIAQTLNAAHVMVRKEGELPPPVLAQTYTGEYRTATCVVCVGDITKSARVLMVDDVLATGGTALATLELVKQTGATMVGCAFLLELMYLKGRQAIENLDSSILTFAAYVVDQSKDDYRRVALDTRAIPGQSTRLDHKLLPSSLSSKISPKVVVMWHPTVVEQALQLVTQYPDYFEPSKIETKRFPDGHYDIKFENDQDQLLGRDLVYVMSLLNPEETLHQLELLIALGRQHLRSFTVLLTYFAPGTKERVDQQGELARAQTTAQLISDSLKAMTATGSATVIIYDIHAVAEQFYFTDSCSLALRSTTSLMAKVIEEKKMTLVFPDAGAYKRFGQEPGLKHVPTIICNKERGAGEIRRITITDRKNCESLSDEELLKRQCVIFDDIGHSGGTAYECMLALKKFGFEHIGLYVTHPVFSNLVWMRFLPDGDRAGFEHIYTTNSVPSVAERYLKHYPDTFTVLDLTPLTVDFIAKKLGYHQAWILSEPNTDSEDDPLPRIVNL